MALAIDVSTSMRDQLDRVTEAALHFTDNLRPLDRALLVTFASQPELLHPPTNNRDALRSALDSLSTPSGKTRSRRGGGTALWDSLVFSLVQLGGIEGRKAVVLLTDGKDSRSQLALHQAAQFVKLSGVPVYLVDLDEIDLAAESGRRRGEGMRARQMVESSGGRLIRVEDDEELGQVYGRIAEELRQQYLLAYVAPGGDPGWRPIQLSVGRSGVVLRAAKGRWQR